MARNKPDPERLRRHQDRPNWLSLGFCIGFGSLVEVYLRLTDFRDCERRRKRMFAVAASWRIGRTQTSANAEEPLGASVGCIGKRKRIAGRGVGPKRSPRWRVQVTL